MLSHSVASCRAVVDELSNDEGLVFKPLLPGHMLEEVFSRYDIDFRDRKFPPDLTLMAFCSQMIGDKRSCSKAVARINHDRALQGLAPCSSSSSGYCQARARLPIGVIRDLARGVAAELESQAQQSWLFKGRHIKVFDGSTLTMPDSPENQAKWPQHGQQAKGTGFPIMRVVALFSLATATVVDFAYAPYQGKGTGEFALARELFRSLNPGDIVVADRLYCSYYFLAKLLELKVDVVVRQNASRTSIFRRGCILGKGDQIIELIKPPRPAWMDKSTYQKMPKTLELREIKTGHITDDGEEVVIVTTLVDPEKYSRTELAACSKKRWSAELDLRSMKTIMGMDVLSCQTPEMIEKEIWTYILAYNLVRQLITRAAKEHGLQPRQISFTGAVDTFTSFLPLFDGRSSEKDMKRYYETMLKLIASHRIGNRPGRREPRAVKRRPKEYPNLRLPRQEAKKNRFDSLT